jgi:uncharacterized membrane protein
LKYARTFIITLFVLGSIFNVANAQSLNQQQAQEAINSYVVNLTVNTDNSVDVTETIRYDTGTDSHHGIFRDINPFSSEGRKMSIQNIRVTDTDKNLYQYSVSTVNGNVRIKIGDPTVTFTGQKTYVITYHATNAVAQLKDIDELYWNVTGNEWGMPIKMAEANITLPVKAVVTQLTCYFGPKGSTSLCTAVKEDNGTYHFSTPSSLYPHSGLTVAVGFAKGEMTPYTASDATTNFFATHWGWIIGILLPILTFIFSFLYWYKKGRDPKGTGIIVPQYDVLDDLTPMEVGGIVNESVNNSQISAEIIYLATKGYIKIRQIEKEFLGFIKQTDYEIIKLKDFTDLSNYFDTRILEGLFTGTDSVNLSDLKKTYYTTASEVVAEVLATLLRKNYYKNLGKLGSKHLSFVSILFTSIWLVVLFSGFASSVQSGNILPLLIGIVLTVLIYVFFSYFSPAKTEKGVAAREYLLGLKEYLQIAEKDRLQFHNAPEKKPEVFEKLLPYAMVLGVTDIWAKEFSDIYTTPPSWYSGTPGSAFNAIIFSQNISAFSSYTASSLVSSPSSSGSGGGGFSGGGGGGGGGGSW